MVAVVKQKNTFERSLNCNKKSRRYKCDEHSLNVTEHLSVQLQRDWWTFCKRITSIQIKDLILFRNIYPNNNSNNSDSVNNIAVLSKLS